MKLLIGASPSKFFHMQEFSKELEKLNIQTKLVLDENIISGFPDRKISNWVGSKTKFNDLISDFKPNMILVDRQKHFAKASIDSKIPVLVHLRGDFWSEIQWAKETIYKKFPKNFVINKWEQIGNYCFNNSQMILPICKFLEKRVQQEVPNSKNSVMYQGINPLNWYHVDKLNLKHPCVGILQSATIWGKAQEMLILPEILRKNPKIMFYWVGDGPYREKILSALNNFENFKWLGSKKYPEQVREFLSEIDIYALISGIDMSPLTLLEAQLMKKPVLASNVGGIPELMNDKDTGFLIEKGNRSQWNEKINLLFNDDKLIQKMGIKGQKFVEENFSWKYIAEKFVNDIKQKLDSN